MKSDADLLVVLQHLDGPSVWAKSAATLAELRSDRLDEGFAQRANAALRLAYPEVEAVSDPSLVASISGLADALLDAIGARWGPSRPIAKAPETIAIPTPLPALGKAIVQGINQTLLEVAQKSHAPDLEPLLIELLELWEQPLEAALLAEAAHRRGIPVYWPRPVGNWFVLGQGVNSRVWHGGHLGDRNGLRDVLGDKLATANILAQAQLPVSRPQVITSPEHALRTAEAIGYPVVIKPNQGRAQVGVWTELTNPEQVRQAFDRAKEQAGYLAGPLLMEQHCTGRYVRATLISGRLAAVASAVAPTATGDGHRTAQALAVIAAGGPETGSLEPRSQGVLESVLSAQGMTPEAVPRKGQRLRIGHANQGPPVDISDRIHPTLRRVLMQVGRLFPVPLLGVDLLMKDPFGPLELPHDVILELNAAPGFGLHACVSEGEPRDLTGPILRSHFGVGWRQACVPVIAAPSGHGPDLERVARTLKRRGIHPAGFTRGRAWSGTPRNPSGQGLAAAAWVPFNPCAEALVLEVDMAMAKTTGLPVERVDHLVGCDDRGDEIAKLLRRQKRRLPLEPELLKV